MAQRRKGFIVVCLLLVYSGVFGQLSAWQPVVSGQGRVPVIFSSKITYSNNSFKPRFPAAASRASSASFSMCNWGADPGPVFHLRPVPVISAGHYRNTLGFMCRQELTLQKKLSLPLVLRLGSPDFVNWMEQKPNARRFD